MSNIQLALEIATKEVIGSIAQGMDMYGESERPKTYKEFIEFVYDGDSAQFKEDLYFTFMNQEQLAFVTDGMEIVNEDGAITNYRKFINMLKKRIWS